MPEFLPHFLMHEDAFHMRCQSKILRFVWSRHITNSSTRSRTKQPQLMAVIRKCRLQGSFTRNEHGLYLQQLVPLETIPRKKKTWPPKDTIARGHPEEKIHQQIELWVDCRRGRRCKGAVYVKASL